MQHSKTDAKIDDEQISRMQEIALEALIAGSTVVEASRCAGVDRSTVHRWLNEAAFAAALNRRRADVIRAAEANLERMLAKAVLTVEAALDLGDVRVGLTLLKGVGLLGGRRSEIGNQDADVMAAEMANDRLLRNLLSPF